MMFRGLDAPESNFVFEHQPAFHNDDLFHDRDDRRISLLPHCGRCLHKAKDRDTFNLDPFSGQLLIAQNVARLGGAQLSDHSLLDFAPRDGDILSA